MLKPDSVCQMSVANKKTWQAGKRKCKFCGFRHVLKNNLCPAYGKKMNKCKGENNFSIMCQRKTGNVVEESESI